jgi:copper resistance protein C
MARAPLAVLLPTALLLAALLLAAVLAPTPAGAHTELASVTPADGAAVADPPGEVVLTFTQPLADPEAAQVQVVDPGGDDLVAAPPTVAGAVVTVPLNLAVTPGPHEVRYAVVAQDEHLLEGVVTFVFAPSAAVATPPGAVPSAPEVAPRPAATPAAGAGATASPAGAGTATPVETASAAAGDADGPTASPTSTPTAAGGGIPPALGVLLAALALAAVGALLVKRVREGGDPAGG